MKLSDKPIILCGFMGSGKTTIGKPLAEKLGFCFADTDQLLTETYHMTIPEMFQKGGEGYFRDLEHQIARRISDLANTVISTGGGMLTFERNGEILSGKGIIVYIHKDFEDCYQRLILQNDRPLVQNKSKDEMYQMYSERIAMYRKYSSFSVENDGTVEEAVKKILLKLENA